MEKTELEKLMQEKQEMFVRTQRVYFQLLGQIQLLQEELDKLNKAEKK